MPKKTVSLPDDRFYAVNVHDTYEESNCFCFLENKRGDRLVAATPKALVQKIEDSEICLNQPESGTIIILQRVSEYEVKSSGIKLEQLL